MDELNLYDDLDDFQEQQEKKSKELQEVEGKYQEALKTIEQLREENKILKKNIQRIELGFQSLLDTARNEIKRKDKEIERLRKENDDICFRRKIPQKSVNTSEKQHLKHNPTVDNPFKSNTKDNERSLVEAAKVKNTNDNEKQESCKRARYHDHERDYLNDHKRHRSNREEYDDKYTAKTKQKSEDDSKESRSRYREKERDYIPRQDYNRNHSRERKDYDKPCSSKVNRKSSESPDRYGKKNARSHSREREKYENTYRHYERNRSREVKNVEESSKMSSRSPTRGNVRHPETKRDQDEKNCKTGKSQKTMDIDIGNQKSKDIKEKEENKKSISLSKTKPQTKYLEEENGNNEYPTNNKSNNKPILQKDTINDTPNEVDLQQKIATSPTHKTIKPRDCETQKDKFQKDNNQESDKTLKYEGKNNSNISNKVDQQPKLCKELNDITKTNRQTVCETQENSNQEVQVEIEKSTEILSQPPSGVPSKLCTPRKVALFNELFGESPSDSATSSTTSQSRNLLLNNIKDILAKSTPTAYISSATTSPEDYTDISSSDATPKGADKIKEIISSANTTPDVNKDINDNQPTPKRIEKKCNEDNDIEKCFVPTKIPEENVKTIACVDLTNIVDDDIANEIEFIQIPGLDLCPPRGDKVNNQKQKDSMNKELKDLNNDDICKEKTETITTENLTAGSEILDIIEVTPNKFDATNSTNNKSLEIDNCKNNNEKYITLTGETNVESLKETLTSENSGLNSVMDTSDENELLKINEKNDISSNLVNFVLPETDSATNTLKDLSQKKKDEETTNVVQNQNAGSSKDFKLQKKLTNISHNESDEIVIIETVRSGSIPPLKNPYNEVNTTQKEKCCFENELPLVKFKNDDEHLLENINKATQTSNAKSHTKFKTLETSVESNIPNENYTIGKEILPEDKNIAEVHFKEKSTTCIDSSKSVVEPHEGTNTEQEFEAKSTIPSSYKETSNNNLIMEKEFNLKSNAEINMDSNKNSDADEITQRKEQIHSSRCLSVDTTITENCEQSSTVAKDEIQSSPSPIDNADNTKISEAEIPKNSIDENDERNIKQTNEIISRKEQVISSTSFHADTADNVFETKISEEEMPEKLVNKENTSSEEKLYSSLSPLEPAENVCTTKDKSAKTETKISSEISNTNKPDGSKNTEKNCTEIRDHIEKTTTKGLAKDSINKENLLEACDSTSSEVDKCQETSIVTSSNDSNNELYTQTVSDFKENVNNEASFSLKAEENKDNVNEIDPESFKSITKKSKNEIEILASSVEATIEESDSKSLRLAVEVKIDDTLHSSVSFKSSKDETTTSITDLQSNENTSNGRKKRTENETLDFEISTNISNDLRDAAQNLNNSEIESEIHVKEAGDTIIGTSKLQLNETNLPNSSEKTSEKQHGNYLTEIPNQQKDSRIETTNLKTNDLIILESSNVTNEVTSLDIKKSESKGTNNDIVVTNYNPIVEASLSNNSLQEKLDETESPKEASFDVTIKEDNKVDKSISPDMIDKSSTKVLKDKGITNRNALRNDSTITETNLSNKALEEQQKGYRPDTQNLQLNVSTIPEANVSINPAKSPEDQLSSDNNVEMKATSAGPQILRSNNLTILETNLSNNPLEEQKSNDSTISEASVAINPVKSPKEQLNNDKNVEMKLTSIGTQILQLNDSTIPETNLSNNLLEEQQSNDSTIPEASVAIKKVVSSEEQLNNDNDFDIKLTSNDSIITKTNLLNNSLEKTQKESRIGTNNLQSSDCINPEARAKINPEKSREEQLKNPNNFEMKSTFDVAKDLQDDKVAEVIINPSEIEKCATKHLQDQVINNAKDLLKTPGYEVNIADTEITDHQNVRENPENTSLHSLTNVEKYSMGSIISEASLERKVDNDFGENVQKNINIESKSLPEETILDSEKLRVNNENILQKDIFERANTDKSKHAENEHYLQEFTNEKGSIDTATKQTHCNEAESQLIEEDIPKLSNQTSSSGKTQKLPDSFENNNEEQINISLRPNESTQILELKDIEAKEKIQEKNEQNSVIGPINEKKMQNQEDTITSNQTITKTSLELTLSEKKATTRVEDLKELNKLEETKKSLEDHVNKDIEIIGIESTNKEKAPVFATNQPAINKKMSIDLQSSTEITNTNNNPQHVVPPEVSEKFDKGLEMNICSNLTQKTINNSQEQLDNNLCSRNLVNAKEFNYSNKHVNVPSKVKLPVGSKLLNSINTISSFPRRKTLVHDQNYTLTYRSKGDCGNNSVNRDPMTSATDKHLQEVVEKETCTQKKLAKGGNKQIIASNSNSKNVTHNTSKECVSFVAPTPKCIMQTEPTVIINDNNNLNQYCATTSLPNVLNTDYNNRMETTNLIPKLCTPSYLLKKVITKEINIEGEIVEVVRLQIPKGNVMLLNQPQQNIDVINKTSGNSGVVCTANQMQPVVTSLDVCQITGNDTSNQTTGITEVKSTAYRKQPEFTSEKVCQIPKGSNVMLLNQHQQSIDSGNQTTEVSGFVSNANQMQTPLEVCKIAGNVMTKQTSRITGVESTAYKNRAELTPSEKICPNPRKQTTGASGAYRKQPEFTSEKVCQIPKGSNNMLLNQHQQSIDSVNQTTDASGFVSSANQMQTPLELCKITGSVMTKPTSEITGVESTAYKNQAELTPSEKVYPNPRKYITKQTIGVSDKVQTEVTPSEVCKITGNHTINETIGRTAIEITRLKEVCPSPRKQTTRISGALEEHQNELNSLKVCNISEVVSKKNFELMPLEVCGAKYAADKNNLELIPSEVCKVSKAESVTNKTPDDIAPLEQTIGVSSTATKIQTNLNPSLVCKVLDNKPAVNKNIQTPLDVCEKYISNKSTEEVSEVESISDKKQIKLIPTEVCRVSETILIANKKQAETPSLEVYPTMGKCITQQIMEVPSTVAKKQVELTTIEVCKVSRAETTANKSQAEIASSEVCQSIRKEVEKEAVEFQTLKKLQTDQNSLNINSKIVPNRNIVPTIISTLPHTYSNHDVLPSVSTNSSTSSKPDIELTALAATTRVIPKEVVSQISQYDSNINYKSVPQGNSAPAITSNLPETYSTHVALPSILTNYSTTKNKDEELNPLAACQTTRKELKELPKEVVEIQRPKILQSPQNDLNIKSKVVPERNTILTLPETSSTRVVLPSIEASSSTVIKKDELNSFAACQTTREELEILPREVIKFQTPNKLQSPQNDLNLKSKQEENTTPTITTTLPETYSTNVVSPSIPANYLLSNKKDEQNSMASCQTTRKDAEGETYSTNALLSSIPANSLTCNKKDEQNSMASCQTTRKEAEELPKEVIEFQTPKKLQVSQNYLNVKSNVVSEKINSNVTETYSTHVILPSISTNSPTPPNFSGIFSKKSSSSIISEEDSMKSRKKSPHFKPREYVLPAVSVLCNVDNLENATKVTKKLHWELLDNKNEMTEIEDDADIDTTDDEPPLKIKEEPIDNASSSPKQSSLQSQPTRRKSQKSSPSETDTQTEDESLLRDIRQQAGTYKPSNVILSKVHKLKHRKHKLHKNVKARLKAISRSSTDTFENTAIMTQMPFSIVFPKRPVGRPRKLPDNAKKIKVDIAKQHKKRGRKPKIKSQNEVVGKSIILESKLEKRKELPLEDNYQMKSCESNVLEYLKVRSKDNSGEKYKPIQEQTISNSNEKNTDDDDEVIDNIENTLKILSTSVERLEISDEPCSSKDSVKQIKSFDTQIEVFKYEDDNSSSMIYHKQDFFTDDVNIKVNKTPATEGNNNLANKEAKEPLGENNIDSPQIDSVGNPQRVEETHDNCLINRSNSETEKVLSEKFNYIDSNKSSSYSDPIAKQQELPSSSSVTQENTLSQQSDSETDKVSSEEHSQDSRKKKSLKSKRLKKPLMKKKLKSKIKKKVTTFISLEDIGIKVRPLKVHLSTFRIPKIKKDTEEMIDNSWKLETYIELEKESVINKMNEEQDKQQSPIKDLSKETGRQQDKQQSPIKHLSKETDRQLNNMNKSSIKNISKETDSPSLINDLSKETDRPTKNISKEIDRQSPINDLSKKTDHRQHNQQWPIIDITAKNSPTKNISKESAKAEKSIESNNIEEIVTDSNEKAKQNSLKSNSRSKDQTETPSNYIIKFDNKTKTGKRKLFSPDMYDEDNVDTPPENRNSERFKEQCQYLSETHELNPVKLRRKSLHLPSKNFESSSSAVITEIEKASSPNNSIKLRRKSINVHRRILDSSSDVDEDNYKEENKQKQSSNESNSKTKSSSSDPDLSTTSVKEQNLSNVSNKKETKKSSLVRRKSMYVERTPSVLQETEKIEVIKQSIPSRRKSMYAEKPTLLDNETEKIETGKSSKAISDTKLSADHKCAIDNSKLTENNDKEQQEPKTIKSFKMRRKSLYVESASNKMASPENVKKKDNSLNLLTHSGLQESSTKTQNHDLKVQTAKNGNQNIESLQSKEEVSQTTKPIASFKMRRKSMYLERHSLNKDENKKAAIDLNKSRNDSDKIKDKSVNKKQDSEHIKTTSQSSTEQTQTKAIEMRGKSTKQRHDLGSTGEVQNSLNSSEPKQNLDKKSEDTKHESIKMRRESKNQREITDKTSKNVQVVEPAKELNKSKPEVNKYPDDPRPNCNKQMDTGLDSSTHERPIKIRRMSTYKEHNEDIGSPLKSQDIESKSKQKLEEKPKESKTPTGADSPTLIRHQKPIGMRRKSIYQEQIIDSNEDNGNSLNDKEAEHKSKQKLQGKLKETQTNIERKLSTDPGFGSSVKLSQQNQIKMRRHSTNQKQMDIVNEDEQQKQTLEKKREDKESCSEALVMLKQESIKLRRKSTNQAQLSSSNIDNEKVKMNELPTNKQIQDLKQNDGGDTDSSTSDVIQREKSLKTRRKSTNQRLIVEAGNEEKKQKLENNSDVIQIVSSSPVTLQQEQKTNIQKKSTNNHCNPDKDKIGIEVNKTKHTTEKKSEHTRLDTVSNQSLKADSDAGTKQLPQQKPIKIRRKSTYQQNEDTSGTKVISLNNQETKNITTESSESKQKVQSTDNIEKNEPDSDSSIVLTQQKSIKIRRKSINQLRILDTSSEDDDDNEPLIKTPTVISNEIKTPPSTATKTRQRRKRVVKVLSTSLESPTNISNNTAPQSSCPASPLTSPMLNHPIFNTEVPIQSREFAASMPMTPNQQDDNKFKEIDSKLHAIFQSPQYTVDYKISPAVDASNLSILPPPTINDTNSNVTLNETPDLNQENNQSSLNVSQLNETTSCLNDTSASTHNNSEIKHLSLGSAEYRFEKVSDNVINLFISRKRKRKRNN